MLKVFQAINKDARNWHQLGCFSQNPQENTCARPDTCNFIKKETLALVFSCEFREFQRTPFYRTPLGNCFSKKHFLMLKDKNKDGSAMWTNNGFIPYILLVFLILNLNLLFTHTLSVFIKTKLFLLFASWLNIFIWSTEKFSKQGRSQNFCFAVG